MKAIADAGFLVAFANRNDRQQDWAVRVAEGITEPALTCEAVLAEPAFHLQSVPLVLAMIRKGLVTLAFDCRDHLPQLTIATGIRAPMSRACGPSSPTATPARRAIRQARQAAHARAHLNAAIDLFRAMGFRERSQRRQRLGRRSTLAVSLWRR